MPPPPTANAHRDLAFHTMQRMNTAGPDHILPPDIPEPIVTGSLPAMAREIVPAQFLHMHVDIEMVWTIADWAPGYDCSAYYDPSSPWYNVFYGAYGLRSYKPDGSAWGFHPDGTPDVAEFLQVPCVDYDFLTAGMFGCPPEKMCFDAKIGEVTTQRGWTVTELAATVPSGLHDPMTSLGDPSTYVIYGIPDPGFISGGRTSYERVEMSGALFMRQVTKAPQAITYAWGVLCPNTPDGVKLQRSIIATLGTKYLEL